MRIVEFEKKNMEQNFSSNPCPRCGAHTQSGAKECLRCGLIFVKWKKMQLGEELALNVVVPVRIELMWQSILDNYEDENAHKSFVYECGKQGCIAFAAQKYRMIMEADPHNVIASKMLGQIINAAALPLQTLREDRPNLSSSAPTPKLFWPMIIMTGILFVIGLSQPSKGFGLVVVALLLFASAFAILYLYRRQN